MGANDDRGSLEAGGKSEEGPAPKVILPSDLARSLSHLSKQDLSRLAEAVSTEMQRRGLSKPSTAEAQSKRARKRASDQPKLTRAQISLIRSSIKAGVKPSALLRQFGISQAQIRAAIQEDE